MDGVNSLRVAIIGYGHGGSIFHAPLVASTPGMRVAAVVTSNPERQARVRMDLPGAEGAGGLLYDLGSHLIDQALVLFGPPTSVYAEVDQRRLGSQVDDDTFVALQFAGGVRAHLFVSYLARLPAPALRLNGLHGTYEKRIADRQEDRLRQGLRPGQTGWGVESPQERGTLRTAIGGLVFDGPLESVPGGYDQFYALVRDAVRDGGPPPVDPRDALATLRVIEAAQRSSKLRTVVQF